MSRLVGVFGLLFAGCALAFGWMFVGDELRDAWRLRAWIQVTGALVEVSGHPRGMGARYHYVYEGRRFEGTRVGFYDGWSGGELNALHVANYRMLRAKLEASGPVRSVRPSDRDGHVLRAIGAGAPITVWLDPIRPDEAVLDPAILWRRLRTPMLVIGVLFAAGLAFAVLGFFSLRGLPAGESAEAMRIRQPIHGTSHRFPIGAWAIGVVWNLFVAIIAFDFRPVPGRETLAWLALGVFVLVGLYIVWRSMLATARWSRYRSVVLELDPYPAEAGGVVAGSLVVPIHYDHAHRFKVVLTCTEHGLHGGELRKNNSFARSLFRGEAQPRLAPAPKGTRVSFRIPVPPQAPASEGYRETIGWTRATARRIFVRWTLEVSAEVEGVDLEETFEVPVRQVEAGEARRASARLLDALGQPAATLPAPVMAPEASITQGARASTVAPRTRLTPQSDARPWMKAVGALLVLLFFGVQLWPFVQDRMGWGDMAGVVAQRQTRAHTATVHDDSARSAAEAPASVREQQPGVADDWRSRFSRALQASLEGRPQDAIRHYAEALAIVERTRGGSDPLAAVMLERIGAIHTDNRDYARAESALRRSLEILEGHAHAAVRAEAGKLVLGFDRESVLRKLGWTLWELRRYPESLAHYQRAYETVAELDLDEASRNYRLAYAAAGIMAGACTQSEWERAERAMAELKQRMARLAERDRRWLEYWVRTGEPRLAARQC